jgi:hypothetical protein
MSSSCYSWISLPTGKWFQWIGDVCIDVNMEYKPSLQSQITETVDTAKYHFTMQLISVTIKYTDVYYCARQTVRGLQCEPRHKTPAGHSWPGLQEALKTQEALSLFPKTGVRRNSQGLPVGLSVFPLLSHISASPGDDRFFFLSQVLSHPHCGSEAGIDFLHLRVLCDQSLCTILHE